MKRRSVHLWRLRISLGMTLLATASVDANAQVQHQLLTDIVDDTRQVDLLWRPPDVADFGKGPWPAILFVHGFQMPDPESGIPPGASAMLETPPRYPLFEIFRRKGFLVAAVSQAGYGRTDGPMDFCGPLSQQAIATAIAALRRHPQVSSGRLFLHGRSRGAMASSMAAAADIGIAGVILESGVYDLQKEYENLRRRDDAPYIYIAANIEREAGTSQEAFVARSLLMTERSIPVPVLILHGEDDVNTPITHARRLEKHLQERGADVRLATFAGAGHHVPVPLAAAEIEAFVARISRSAPAGSRTH